MTLRNFPAPSQKTLDGGGCVRVLRPGLPIAQSGAASAPFHSHAAIHSSCLTSFTQKKKSEWEAEAMQKKKKRKKKLLGFMPRAHEAGIFRIPKPIICIRASLFAEEEFSFFFAPTNVTIHVAGRTDGRLRELSSLLVLRLQIAHFEFGAADTCCALRPVYLRRR